MTRRASRTGDALRPRGLAAPCAAALFAFAFVFAGVTTAAPARRPSARTLAAAPRAPRLVVAILFDQYRADYLDRYARVFGPDGFRRLEREGAVFTDCTIPYAHTLTGPGHATWLSGVPPSVHGIVGNEWFDRGLGRAVSAVDDPGFASVGVPGEGDPASPRLMRAQTVADALRTRTLGRARVIALSDKARGAVLPAGRRPSGVYWQDDASALLQTSTYYASELPAWAQRANEVRAREAAQARERAWTPLLPPAAYDGTLVADSADVFPHPAATGRGDRRPNAVPLVDHPYSLEAVFEFARAAVTGERLGEDDVPDLLILSVSVTDRVGHRYGPDSPEALDMAARCDRSLAEFLRFLDARVGRGAYAVTVTGDHGVAPTPDEARRFEAAPFDSVGSLPVAAERGWIERVVGGPNAQRVVRAMYNGDITFNDSTLAALHLTRARAARTLADSALASPWFAAAYTADELASAHGEAGGDGVFGRVVRGFFPGRSGDVTLVGRPYVVFGLGGHDHATHGSPYRYDTHVPFLVFGAGVRPGVYRAAVSTLDIAPTVAALLGVDPPAQCEGHARTEALLP